MNHLSFGGRDAVAATLSNDFIHLVDIEAKKSKQTLDVAKRVVGIHFDLTGSAGWTFCHLCTFISLLYTVISCGVFMLFMSRDSKKERISAVPYEINALLCLVRYSSPLKCCFTISCFPYSPDRFSWGFCLMVLLIFRASITPSSFNRAGTPLSRG